MSVELDRKLSQLFHEVTVLAEEEMRAYRRVSASTVRTLISAAYDLVRLREKKAEVLKARIAELEGDLKLIDVALMAKKALQDGFVDIPAEIDSAEKFIEWINKEPGNEG